MPRIHNQYSECVVYIYRSIADAKSGARAGGSGFIVHIPLENHPAWSEAYVITNRHVVEEAQTPVIRINRQDATVEYFETKKDEWIFHPDGDDIAALVFETEISEQLKIRAVGLSLFLTRTLVAKEDVGIGDEVFMLGRFINHEGRQQNVPAIRFGNIAMMPDEKIIAAESGIAQESFLVETRSLPGYSGSPVFLYSVSAMMDFSRRDLKEEEEQLRAKEREKTGRQDLIIDPGLLVYMRPKGPFLLGIDWCHLNTIEKVREKNGDPISEGWIVRTNSGMAGVIPAWKIEELLNGEELTQMRRIEDDKMSARK